MSQTWNGRPGHGSGAASTSTNDTASIPRPGMCGPEDAHLYDTGASPSRAAVSALQALEGLAERLTWSVLADALREGTAAHWVRRARELETVGTPWADEAAREARRHAWLIATYGVGDELLDDLRAGVAA